MVGRVRCTGHCIDPTIAVLSSCSHGIGLVFLASVWFVSDTWFKVLPLSYYSMTSAVPVGIY